MTSRGRKEGQREKTDGDIFESWDRGGWGGHPVIMRIKGKKDRRDERARECGKCKMEKEGGRELEKGEVGHALKHEIHTFLSTPTVSKRWMHIRTKRGISKQLNTSAAKLLILEPQQRPRTHVLHGTSGTAVNMDLFWSSLSYEVYFKLYRWRSK